MIKANVFAWNNIAGKDIRDSVINFLIDETGGNIDEVLSIYNIDSKVFRMFYDKELTLEFKLLKPNCASYSVNILNTRTYKKLVFSGNCNADFQDLTPEFINEIGYTIVKLNNLVTLALGRVSEISDEELLLDGDKDAFERTYTSLKSNGFESDKYSYEMYEEYSKFELDKDIMSLFQLN